VTGQLNDKKEKTFFLPFALLASDEPGNFGSNSIETMREDLSKTNDD
jgi:hypothetical protein